MTDLTIECPKCGTEIKLTESLAAPLVAQKVEEARGQIRIKEESRARTLVEKEMGDQAGVLKELKLDTEAMKAKLTEAQQDQAKARKQQREFEDAKRELDLTIEKRVRDSMGSARLNIRTEVEGEMKLKVLEKEEQLAGMTRQIEDLKRKAEQGSQQSQGEALEVELEASLRTKFPHDQLLAVDKGVRGADVVQVVHTSQGQPCGAIIWECKRTKAWSPGWLPKLREDQRVAKAEVAVLVTQVMPLGAGSFEFIDGVWVTNTKTALPVATILRQGLIEAASVKQSLVGSDPHQESC